MTGLLRAELRKLRRRAVLVLVAVGLLATAMMTAVSREFASDQGNTARDQLAMAQSLRPDRATCAEEELRPGAECRAILAEDLRGAQQFAREHGVTVAAATELGRPAGALSFAAGTIGSAIGMVVLLAVAALHVGGEWQRDRGTLLMSSGSPRWRLLVAKATSTWLVGVLLLLAGTLVVLLVSVASAGLWALPDLPGSPPDAPPPLTRAAGALGVMAAWAAIAVAVAVAVRDGRLALLAGAGVLGLLVASATLGGPSPGAAIGRFTEGSRIHGIYDSLWPATDAHASVALAVVATVALAGAAFAAAVWWVNRSDHA